ncbi:hypothetical protein TNCV_2552901 [Trichonephila clavipes]|nr:hypothetical protein TNCV_2552901 [Trichonephila clavipes]
MKVFLLKYLLQSLEDEVTRRFQDFKVSKLNLPSYPCATDIGPASERLPLELIDLKSEDSVIHSVAKNICTQKKLSYIHEICCLPSASRHALLAKDLVTWQSFILEDIVGRVAQYVDEHYPVDKWHLGDLIAWVAQSALKNIVHVLLKVP